MGGCAWREAGSGMSEEKVKRRMDAELEKLWENEVKTNSQWKKIVEDFKDPSSLAYVPRIVTFCMEQVEVWAKIREWDSAEKKQAAEWLVDKAQKTLASSSVSWLQIAASLIDVIIEATRGQINVNKVVGVCEKIGRKCCCRR